MRLFYLVLIAGWIGLGWMAQTSFEAHAQASDKVELCQQMTALRGKMATAQKELRTQLKPLNGDPELQPLSQNVVQARQAVKEANKTLEEAMQQYQAKRLAKIKAMPEAASLHTALESLKPQVADLQKQLRQAAACPKVAK